MRYSGLLCTVLLTGCTAVTNADQIAVKASANRIEPEIIKACTASGLFRPVRNVIDGVIVAAEPIAAIPLRVKNAGVDMVCADPARFAHDVSTVEWVVRNLGGK